MSQRRGSRGGRQPADGELVEGRDAVVGDDLAGLEHAGAAQTEGAQGVGIELDKTADTGDRAGCAKGDAADGCRREQRCRAGGGVGACGRSADDLDITAYRRHRKCRWSHRGDTLQIGLIDADRGLTGHRAGSHRGRQGLLQRNLAGCGRQFERGPLGVGAEEAAVIRSDQTGIGCTLFGQCRVVDLIECQPITGLDTESGVAESGQGRLPCQCRLHDAVAGHQLRVAKHHAVGARADRAVGPSQQIATAIDHQLVEQRVTSQHGSA